MTGAHAPGAGAPDRGSSSAAEPDPVVADAADGAGAAGDEASGTVPGAPNDSDRPGGSAAPGPSGGGDPGDAAAFADLEAAMAEAAADLDAADLDAAEAAAEMTIDLTVATLARERDEYLDALRRLQADFENYKKRVEKQQREHVERAAGELVGKLLAVCDTADLAIAHGGGEEVKQVWTALFDALEREGLERIDPVGVPFDPTVHDAVAHDPGDSGAAGPEVVEVFRTGYRWKGRVLRPAMVKVKG